MALSGQSLNSATVTGPGTAIAFDKPMKHFSMNFNASGSPSSVSVALEGSIDGVNFGTLGSQSSNGSLAFNASPVPLLFVRANLLALTGGSSPSVDVWVAASD